jgi:hypothetical protein
VNPNIAVICTSSLPSETPDDTRLFINVVDVVAGKILHRVVQENAVQPIRGVIMDNFILITYWNNKVTICSVGHLSFNPDLFPGKAK